MPLGCNRGNSSNELESSIRAYSHAMLTGDQNKAWALMSRRCQQMNGKLEVAAMSELIRLRFHDEEPHINRYTDLEGQVLTDSLDDGPIFVDYSFPTQPDLTQEREPWIWQDDIWRNDEC